MNYLHGNNSRSAACVQLGYGWNKCPFSSGYGISRNVPSHVHCNKLSAPSTLLQCGKWKKAYAIASLSPLLRICSGGKIKLFISNKYFLNRSKLDFVFFMDFKAKKKAYFRHMWVKLDSTVYGIYSAHFSQIETSFTSYIGWESNLI